jgi:ubiquinone/menaquinone biosynthesis C-methylase UbiE
MSNRDDEPSPDTERVARGFDAAYTAVRQSPTYRRIWREVYAEDYPEEAEPFSAVTLTDLRRMARALALGPGQTFADLACGAGGPGLWVARETGASLVGVDLSSVAIGQAGERAEAWGLSERATFRVGEAAATGLDSASFAGVISIDAFWLFPDKPAAAAEVARILQPGGRFVFTTWECRITPPGWPAQLADHHDVLEQAGLVVETYEETPDWERRQRAVSEAALAARADLIAEMGDVADSLHSDPAYIVYRRRILVVARKSA